MRQLKEVKISGFKNINHQMTRFDTIRHFNILLGQNNIGKSTLLQTLDLLENREGKKIVLINQTKIQIAFIP